MSKIALTPNASGTGTLTIAAPNTSTDRTITLPDETGSIITTGSSGQVIPIAALPAGSIIQIVRASTNTEISFTNTGTNNFNFQCAITPLYSTSKILGFITMTGVANASAGRMAPLIVYDTTSGGTSGTNISGNLQVAQNSTDTNGLSTVAGTFLVGTIGSTNTYYFKNIVSKGDAGGTNYVQRYNNESSIVLMEIAA